MTLNFYVSYLVPVEPQKLERLEKEAGIAGAALTEAAVKFGLGEISDIEYKEAGLRLSRIRAQMEPERRREPAIMRSTAAVSTEWRCPRDGCDHCVALIKYGGLSFDTQCKCGAEVHKEELPMSLGLYRTRTRRTDGVEVQASANGSDNRQLSQGGGGPIEVFVDGAPVQADFSRRLIGSEK